jgi:16S rRNA (guanine527-N7)-methyltransferase
VTDDPEYASRAAAWAGLVLTSTQIQRLARFRAWLRDEAIDAGGLGPAEAQRLWRRHIADSLLFGVGLDRTRPCVDLGTGVGLPGIPLAIALPNTRFRLIDRSGRRCDLLVRAVRILDLENCTIEKQDISTLGTVPGSIVSRAALPIERSVPQVGRLLAPGSAAIVGLSHGSRVRRLPEFPSETPVEVIEVPARVLDTAVHLLRIVRN